MTWQASYREKSSLLVLVWVVFYALSVPSVANPEGSNPMDLVLLNEAGEPVRLGQMATVPPLLLYFWATWCKPCRTTTPKITRLAEKYRDRVQVLGINVGGVDSLKDVNKYRSRHRITYPMLLDRDNQTLEAYSIVAIPTIILLDNTGKILYRGHEPPTNLEKLLQE